MTDFTHSFQPILSDKGMNANNSQAAGKLHIKNQKVKPIFVTGSPRSGTTWLGKMLALSDSMYYLHEPFNPDMASARAICNIDWKYPFTYICEENGSDYYNPIKKMFESKYDLKYGLMHATSLRGLKNVFRKWHELRSLRKKGCAPLVKDPIGIMTCEWLNRHFDISTIVMSRHPAAFVASMKRLEWGSRPEVWALQQKFLMRDYLGPFEEEIRALQSGDHGVIERATLAWKLHHHVIHLYKTKHKDWIFVRHEDISRDPINAFQDLYARTALSFTPGIRQSLEEYCNASNPVRATAKEKPIKLNSKATISNWKSQLSAAEIEYIRQHVEDVSAHFYSDSDWDLTDDSHV